NSNSKSDLKSVDLDYVKFGKPNIVTPPSEIKSPEKADVHSDDLDLDPFKVLFSDGLGKLKDFRASIQLKEGAKPKYHKYRPVPLAQKVKVEKELDRLLEAGIISPMQFSRWATPIVVVPKPDGTVRIVSDYSVSILNYTLNIIPCHEPRTCFRIGRMH